MIHPSQIVAFDVETWGKEPLYALQPFRALAGDAWLTTCAIAEWVDGDVVTDGLVKPTVEQLAAWLEEVVRLRQYVVCWNAPFDVAWLIALGLKDLAYKVNWLDGMLLERHLINAPRFRPEGRVSLGLKAVVERYYPEQAGYEDDVKFDAETPEEVAKLLFYNERDCYHTLKHTIWLLTQLPAAVIRCALIEARAIPLAAQTMVDGIVGNVEKAAALAVKLDDTRKLEYVQLKMKFPEDVSEEVLSSPKQLGKLLFKTWGLPVVKLTDTGDWSTDKEALLTLALDDPRAQAVYNYREAKNNLTKFAQGLVDSVAYNGDGKTRPQVRLFGTYTGRCTYSSKVGRGVAEQPSGVAIHQWKRDPDFRELIMVEDDEDLIELDFAGQEFRWMAVESGDPVMLNLCQPGEDAHSYMSARIPGVGWQYEALRAAAGSGDKAAKAVRQMGKFTNLALQYRTYPKTMVKIAAIQHNLKITLPEAEAIRATYLTTYRAVPVYWKRQIAKARQLGYIETKAGRRVQLGPVAGWKWSDDSGMLQDWTWGHESTAINFPIQGVGADQKYLALLVARDYLPKRNARFVMELHDGLFFAAKKTNSMQVLMELRQLLSNLPYKKAWGVDLPINFPVDGKIGPSWGQLKEIA